MNKNITDLQAIEILLKNINNAWTQGNPKELGKYFHHSMIIEGPELRGRKVGLDQCVQHHEEVLRHIKIISYKESDYRINVWSDTAVANFQFEVQLETEGKIRKELGRELYTFSRDVNNWKAVWNFIVPYVD